MSEPTQTATETAAAAAPAVPPAAARGWRLAGIAAAGAGLLALPWGLSPFYLDFATLIVIFALFAVSLDLLVGYAGMISLGHAAYFGIGAYTTALLADAGVGHAALLLPASVGAAALAAAVLGGLAVRTAGVSFIMITLALAQLVYFVALNASWAGSTNGMLMFSRPVTGIPGIDLEAAHQFYYYCLLWSVAGFVFLQRLVGAPFGRALQGIRANEERMRALGFRTGRYRWIAFVIAGAAAGLAGHLFVSLQFFIDPTTLHWSASGQVLMMVLLGGVGTLLGPVLGAVIFHGLEEVISSYTEHWMLPMGVILVLLVLFARGGVLGLARRAWARWGNRREGTRGD